VLVLLLTIMPRVSDKHRLLRDIDMVLRILALQQQTYRHYNPERASAARKKGYELLGIRAGIEEQRYMNPRRRLNKMLGALQVLPSLEVDEFIQEVRVSQETFCFILSEIAGDLFSFFMFN
jgi:hypothetical protein